MRASTIHERLAENGLRLPDSDLAAFTIMVAELDRIAASLAAAPLIYADEPAVIFRAPQG
jgi:hypothetical protein